MREIKFRAWGFDKMNYEPEITYNDTDSINQVFHQTGLTFMQYTGLKDKSGVEIYEEDLLRLDDGTGVWKVVWLNTMFQLERPDRYGYHQDTNFDGEVIGNIYENPELLK